MHMKQWYWCVPVVPVWNKFWGKLFCGEFYLREHCFPLRVIIAKIRTAPHQHQVADGNSFVGTYGYIVIRTKHPYLFYVAGQCYLQNVWQLQLKNFLSLEAMLYLSDVIFSALLSTSVRESCMRVRFAPPGVKQLCTLKTNKKRFFIYLSVLD